ncbi:MAG: hypothetical protein Q4A71_04455 [Actinomycetaceae bacterium]|nr:hypothetical protein [Actinomycetaceae bacterium]
MPSSDRLTDGTFMVLLGHARKPTRKARESLAGKAEGLNDRELLKSLLRIFVPTYFDPPDSTFSQNASDYRSCKQAQGLYLPFDEPTDVDGFDQRIRNQYAAPLAAMKDLVDTFLDVESKADWLVSALLGLVEEDTSIADDQELFVLENGQAIPKSELLCLKNVCLDSLLLGLWHYILTKVPDNLEGRSTFQRWHDEHSVPNSRWKINLRAVPTSAQTVSVTRYVADPVTAKPSSNDYEEVLEGEFVEDDHEPQGNYDSSENDLGSAESVPSKTQVFVFQGGTGNTQIGHVRTLNIGGWQK